MANMKLKGSLRDPATIKRLTLSLPEIGGKVPSGVIRASDRPNAVQQQMISRKYGMFIHFGINTFHDMEWTDGSKPSASYNPGAVDTDQWARTARDAGMKYVILTAKHHDGFCLWDSKYTDYGVANSPNTTDVVAALANSCRKYEIQMGLYYSLWDRHEPTYNDDEAYVEYMLKQLSELLSQFGPVCELWFDGGWKKKPGAVGYSTRLCAGEKAPAGLRRRGQLDDRASR